MLTITDVELTSDGSGESYFVITLKRGLTCFSVTLVDRGHEWDFCDDEDIDVLAESLEMTAQDLRKEITIACDACIDTFLIFTE